MSTRSPSDGRHRFREQLRRRAVFLDGALASHGGRGRYVKQELEALTWALAALTEVTERGLMPELADAIDARVDAHRDGADPLW